MFFDVVQIVRFQVRFLWSKKLCTLQVIEVIADLCGSEEPPDLTHKFRHLHSELGILLGDHYENEEFLANQIVRDILQPAGG